MSILTYLNPGDWTASIDLKDAYHHVPIAAASRDLLGFTFDTALRAQALTSPIHEASRMRGRFSPSTGFAIFLPQRLAAGSQLAPLALLLQTVQALGFLINWDKSEHVPTQCPIFLGATIDIPRQLARPSPRRIATIVAAARLLRGRRQPAAFSQELSTGPGPPIQMGPPAPDDPPPLPEVEPSRIPALGQPIEGPPTHHNGDLGHLPHGMGGGGGVTAYAYAYGDWSRYRVLPLIRC